VQLGIDASSLRAGGGVTHLIELLRAAQPQDHGFDRVIVWGAASTLSRLEDRPWLCKVHEPLLDKALPMRVYWQRFMLGCLARQEGCDLLFVPGGTYPDGFRPFVTMSRTLLPFDWPEARRYGFSWTLLRLMLLRRTQSHTFRDASGVIFLTNYAQDVVMQMVQQLSDKSTVIPHGVNVQFRLPPRAQDDIGTYSLQKPFRLLYVSAIDMYKHQWYLAEAVAQLRKEGMPIQLDLIGHAYTPALKRLSQVLRRLDLPEAFIRYRGPISHSEMVGEYHKANLFVFASTCETFGQILTEAMAAGLPIACSNRSSMYETLGDAGVYFNSEQPSDIAKALKTLIDSPVLRTRKAEAAYGRAQNYTWRRCAQDTFVFLSEVVSKYKVLHASLKK
jgi:glycosyltransferase involved in cell wall biosynthesis